MGIKADIIKAEVQINANSAMKALNDLSKSTSDLKKENDSLKVAKAKLLTAENQDKKAIKALDDQIKANNKTIKDNKSKMDALQKSIGLGAMSATQLRKKSKELSRDLDSMSKAANPKEYKRLAKELSAVDRQLDKVKRGATATQKMWQSVKNTGAGILGAFSLGAIVGKIVEFGKSIFDLSVKMEGEATRANIVFGKSLNYVEKQAEKLHKKMGVTKNEFIAAASATADLLIPLNFTREQSAEMSVQLQSLTGALDEWTAGQVGASEISAILTKAMLGENEQLKRLGIAIRKDSQEFRDLVKHKLATTNATKAQAEAMATLELINHKSADAQAAYNLEADTLLRKLKALKLWWRNLKEGVVEFFNTPVSEKLKRQRVALNRNVESLIIFNDNQKRRGDYIKKIQQLYPAFFANMDTEKMKIEQIRDRLKEVNAQFVTRIKLAATSEQLQEQEEKSIKAQTEIFETIDKMPLNFQKAVADYEKGIISLSQLRKTSVFDDNKEGSLKNGYALYGELAHEKVVHDLIEEYLSLRNVIEEANKEQEKLTKRKSGLEKILGKDNSGEVPSVFETINDKIKTTRENIKQLKQDLDDLRSGKKKSSNLKGDIEKTQKRLKEEESLLSIYTGNSNTETDIEKWKTKAKELVVQAQREIATAKIEAMDEGLAKEKAKEEQRWNEELAALESRKFQKNEKQKELLPEQLAANEEINKLIEEQRAAHLRKIDDLDAAHRKQKKIKATEDKLLQLDEDMLKAEGDNAGFERKMELAKERFDIEFAAAEGNRSKELEARKKFSDSINKIQEEQHRKEEVRRQATESLAKGLFGNMKAMAKKGSALAKALYLFEQAMAIRQVIINTEIANAKAVSASPFTFGQPWVGINTALGAASVGLILAQTVSEFKGKEEGGYLDVRRQQDGKMFRAKYKPNHRGYTQGPTVITGENGTEFVANAKAAKNPTIRPFLDIIDAAQKQGTIETLDLTAVRNEYLKGYVKGGYLAPTPDSVFDTTNVHQQENDRQEELMELIRQLATRPIEFSLLRFDEARQMQEEIDEEINR